MAMEIYHIVLIATALILQVYSQQNRNQYNAGSSRNTAFGSNRNTQQQSGGRTGGAYSSGRTNQKQNAPAASAANCPDKNGRYPTGTCEGYIECIDGIGEEKNCPDGLYYNPNKTIFQYPCVYPNEIDCADRPEGRAAEPTEECPRQFGYFRVGDEQNCGQFMNCADGRAFILDCPEGLAFNDETYKCDWPDEVASCNAEAYLGFTCPPEAKGLTSAGYKFFRSDSNCQKYFLCINSKPRLLSCGEDEAFNEMINACDGVENVTGCAGSGQGRNAGPQPTTVPTRYSNQQQQRPGYNNQRQSRPQGNVNSQSRGRATTQNYRG